MRYYKKILFSIFCINCLLIYPVFGQAEQKQDDMRLQNAKNEKKQFYILPIFYLQTGIGVGQANKITQNTPLTTKAFPSFMMALGFYQPFEFYYVNTGFKVQIAYEIGLKSFGENTEAFRNANVFFQVYIGYKYFLPYVGIGYETLSVANAFLPSKNDVILHKNHGIAYNCGFNLPINKHHALDLSLKFSKTYEFAPRVLLAYELRF